MSTLSYEQEYRQVLSDIGDIQQEDLFLNQFPRVSAYFTHFYPSMYLRYIQLARRLTLLHNVELQPQKLVDVRTMLDSCLGRVLQLKAALADRLGAHFFLDNLMVDLKLSPRDVEVPIPSYILDDRAEELKDRRNVILSLQRFYSESDPEAPVSQALVMSTIRDDPTKAIPPLPTKKAPPPPPKTLEEIEQEPMEYEEAVRVLQICERGRQARQRAKFQLSLYNQQRYSAIHGQDFNTVTGKDRAATIIQTVVQGYLERKRAVERFQEEELFLGLKPPGYPVGEEAEAAARRVEERKAKQKMNVMVLRQKTTELEASIKASEGPKTMEAMLDEVLLHMAYARLENKDGQIPEFPSPEEGGSLSLLGQMNNDKDKLRRRSSKRGSKAFSETGSNAGGRRASSVAPPGDASNAGDGAASAGAEGGAPKKKKSKKSEEEEEGEPLPKSAFWLHMEEGRDRYENIWKQRFTNMYLHDGNMDLPCDENILRQELLEGPRGIMHQLRSCVDDLVMMEVANLKERLEWERKNKRKKKKKAKKGKKVKKPKLKDPTKGVDLTALTSMAVIENKFQLPPSTVRLKDFIGPENLMGKPWAETCTSPVPNDDIYKKWLRVIRGWNDQVANSMKISITELEALFEKYIESDLRYNVVTAGEIRRAVTENAILPLGSQVIHDMSYHHSTMLFYGFPGSGKTMVAFAVCNEAGANMFNLSPGNFRSMKGIAKQIQNVFYLARMKGPSVIYVENVEKIFPAKVKGKKKNDGLTKRGKKMKKEMIKSINSLLSTDRVTVIFVSSEPWLIDLPRYSSLFGTAVYFGPPDYATRMELLDRFIRDKLGARYEGLTLEGLQQVALLCDGYTVGQVQSLVNMSLHPRRIQCISQRKLDSSDFVGAASLIKPPTKEQVLMMTESMYKQDIPYRMMRGPHVYKEANNVVEKKKKK